MHDEAECNSTAKGFLVGLGIGSLVGAGLALLFAPKAGTETREDIKTAAGQIKTKAGELAEDVTESSEELVKKSKELLQTTKSKIKEVVETSKEALARKKSEIGDGESCGCSDAESEVKEES
jgi:gas vesicle protein